MQDFTADNLIKKARAGEKIDRADLKGIQLAKAMLEGITMRRCDLDGANLEGAKLRRANLKNSSLREAYLAGVDLRDANLDNVDLEGANLERALLTGANLTRANLEGADLTGANISGAKLNFAQLQGLTGADMSGADLSEVDLRDANLTRAKLDGATLTGAKIAGVLADATSVEQLMAAWIDVSLDGDGSRRVAVDVASLFKRKGPIEPSLAPTNRRYFGRGDVLRDAILQFDEGAQVQIDSVFEKCSIVLGRGSSLVIGSAGVLAECQITGEGDITIHGQFFERASPGIVGAKQLLVTSGGALVSTVQHTREATRFAFERGCRLRMKVVQAGNGYGGK